LSLKMPRTLSHLSSLPARPPTRKQPAARTRTPRSPHAEKRGIFRLNQAFAYALRGIEVR